MIDSLWRDGSYQSSESRKARCVPFGIYTLFIYAGVIVYTSLFFNQLFYYKDFLLSIPDCHPG